jgi:hypothetical protein
MGPSLLFKPNVLVLLLVLITALCPVPGESGGAPDIPADGTEEAPVQRFSLDFRVLTYGAIQGVAASTQNPSNNFLQIPRYVANLELRPDARLNLDPLDLSAKPRARLYYSAWQEGGRQGESQWDTDWFVNEWLARLKVRPDLFLSYGRENLQWGPSFLYSPSNPFFRDNGRRNPYLEVPGMDFARIVWIPESSWAMSFIVNTDEGLNRMTGPGRFLASTLAPPAFEKTYSLKIDYTGRERYASIVLSRRADSENILGYFGGWTVSDAVLLYSEGSFTKGSQALYPVAGSSPLGAPLQPLYQNASSIYPVLLFGGSYTFEAGGTVTTEYTYYGPGYNNSEANQYYAVRGMAATAFSQGGSMAGPGQLVLGQTAVTGLQLLRRNYLMIQYIQNNTWNVLDLTFRWTQNLDDGSGQFTSVVAYSLGKHSELFSVGTVTAGGRNTEFRSLIDYQWMAGLKYTF